MFLLKNYISDGIMSGETQNHNGVEFCIRYCDPIGVMFIVKEYQDYLGPKHCIITVRQNILAVKIVL